MNFVIILLVHKETLFSPRWPLVTSAYPKGCELSAEQYQTQNAMAARNVRNDKLRTNPSAFDDERYAIA